MNSYASIFTKRFLLPLVAAGCLVAADQGITPLSLNRALITIDGSTFTASDVEKKSQGALFQAQNAYYDAQRKAADQFVNDYLLERQAKKEQVTVEELLRRHVDSTIAKDPSEDALRVYYDGLDTAEPFEAIRGKIVEVIRQRRTAKIKNAYIQSLRSQANVSFHIVAPRAQVSAGAAPVRGTSTAPVTLLEYADYECPYCQQIQPVIARLEAEYKGKLAFSFKDVPLPMHANAQKAAEAAHCAGAQGKYWEYHDLLFSSKQYGIAQLKEHARSLKLDGPSFDRCLDTGAQAERIKASVAEAQSVGLPGTPGFFVNGRFVNGAVDYQTLKQAIDEELNATSPKPGVSANASIYTNSK